VPGPAAARSIARPGVMVYDSAASGKRITLYR
jgi:hypothetical protein